MGPACTTKPPPWNRPFAPARDGCLQAAISALALQTPTIWCRGSSCGFLSRSKAPQCCNAPSTTSSRMPTVPCTICSSTGATANGVKCWRPTSQAKATGARQRPTTRPSCRPCAPKSETANRLGLPRRRRRGQSKSAPSCWRVFCNLQRRPPNARRVGPQGARPTPPTTATHSCTRRAPTFGINKPNSNAQKKTP